MTISRDAVAAGFEQLGARYDKLFDLGLPKAVSDSVGNALSKWQDFFYGGADGTIDTWATILETANRALDAAAAQGIIQGTVPLAKPIKIPAATKQLGVSYVTAQPGFAAFAVPEFKAPSKWFAIVPLAIVGFLLLRKS